jgi:uncharacterized protein (TIGR02646 family)
VIHVAKPALAVPKPFRKAADAETREAIRHFLGRATRSKPFAFRAYRNAELKAALEHLFHGKCAYCEWRYGGGSYMEVEHYRPKSHYYWLAADWKNLLPACKRCNNGKLSEFPLVDPARQARRRGEEKRERPLLLNPSDGRERPEKHLRFDARDGAVSPARDARKRPSDMGMASIRVYRLARATLSLDRKEWSIRVRHSIEFCRLAERARDRKRREVAFRELKRLVEPDQPFRALTLEILRQEGFGSSSRRQP